MRKGLIALLLCAIFASGCSNNTPDANVGADYIKRSQAYQAQGQYRAALIEAKNARQKGVDAESADVQTAQILLEMGSSQSALLVLEPYGKNGAPATLAALIEAHLQLGKFTSAERLLSDHGDTLKAEMPIDFMVLVARASAGLNQFAAAEKAYQDVLNQDPQHLAALNSLANLALAQQQPKQALHYLNQAAAIAPNDPALLFTRARLAYQHGDLEAAENALNTALIELPRADVVTPQKRQVLRMLADLLTQQGRPMEAMLYEKLVAQADPEGHDVNQKLQEADTLFQAGKLKEAEALLLDVQSQYGDALSGTALGLVNYASGHIEEAGQYFSRFLDVETASPQARRAYALSQLQANAPQQALDIMKTENEQDPNNAVTLSIYGLAALSAGDSETGLAAIERSLTLAPGNARLRLALAQYYAQTNRLADALAQTQHAMDTAPADTRVQATHASVLLAGKKTAQAQRFVKDMVKRYPNAVESYQLAGTVFMALNAPQAAKPHWQRALAMIPNSSAAHYALGDIALKAQDSALATQHFEAVIAHDPSQFNAYKGLMSAYENTRNTDDAVNILKKFAATHTSEAAPLAVLGEYWLEKGKTSQAIAVLDKAVSRSPQDAAVRTLSAAAYWQAAQTQMSARRWDEARDNLNKALIRQPGHIKLMGTLAQLEMRAGKLQDAENILDALATNPAAAGVASELRGDLAVSQQQLNRALEQYRAAWDAQARDIYAVKLTAVLNAKKDAEAAQAFYEEWQVALPLSPEPHVRQALAAQASGDHRATISHYEAALKKAPDSPVILNNLAWFYHVEKDARARATAEKGYRLAPNDATMLDTYGDILLSVGEREKALAVLEKAASLAPENADIQAHLVKARSANR